MVRNIFEETVYLKILSVFDNFCDIRDRFGSLFKFGGSSCDCVFVELAPRLPLDLVSTLSFHVCTRATRRHHFMFYM
jgi:hypothetical protein